MAPLSPSCVCFGNRRKPQNFPLLLREDVADQVVLVQPLPLAARRCASESASSGFNGIIDQDDVGTASSQHAPVRGGKPLTKQERWRSVPPRPRPSSGAPPLSGSCRAANCARRSLRRCRSPARDRTARG